MGSHRVLAGIKVISAREKIIIPKKGSIFLVTLAMVVFPTPQPMKRQVPTGGVQRPMERFAIIVIPKCTGCIPKEVTTGKKIGVKIKIAGVMSIKVPTPSNIRLIVKRIRIGFSDSPSKSVLTVWGIFAMVMIQLIAELALTSIITMAVVIPLCKRISGISRREISR